MTRAFFCFIVLLMAASVGSSRAENKPTGKPLASYKETPGFIKAYIASAFRDSFLIAEKGEKWNSSCVFEKGRPSYQFISATLGTDQYRLDYLSGGFALSKRTLLIRFRGDEILSHSMK